MPQQKDASAAPGAAQVFWDSPATFSRGAKRSVFGGQASGLSLSRMPGKVSGG